ncbi:MAG: squalene/phytoene synthase family protein [Candidatus Anstonellaceae archaeon]
MKNKEKQLCWELLPKVSRSFALCIRILPKPLNEQMMVSYLIYRVLDTIEDSQAKNSAKGRLFAEFLSLLAKRKVNAEAVEECRAKMLAKLTYTYEKDLLDSLPAVVAAYYSQPKEVRKHILKRGRAMAHGMYEFQKRRIETFGDQNRYSHYVAGVIGYLFNDLLHYNGIIGAGLKARLRKYARHFGLALQKVNILRDIAHDISANRRYWPEKLIAKYGLSYETLCRKESREAALKILHEQIENAKNYLESAMRYVMLLPEKALQVRMFCLIPLFMAIESYVKCVGNHELFDNGKVVKIDREQVYEIVAKSRMWGSSNERISKWFVSAMMKVSPEFERGYAKAIGY